MSDNDKSAPAMQTYTRKPEPVRAVQWHKPGDHPAVVREDRGRDYIIRGPEPDHPDGVRVSTTVEPGDWIVEHEDGEVEVVGDEWFAMGYCPAPPASDATESAAWLIGKLLDQLGSDDKVVARGEAEYPQTVLKASRLRALLAAAEPRRRGPSREWLERAGEVEDATRSVSVGGLAVDTGMYGVAASLAQEARDRAAAKDYVPSKPWALGFAFGLRDGCPGPERFWEHAPDFQRGFDAARSIKGEMPAEARSQVGEATRKVLECIADHLEGRDDDDPEASFAVWHRIDDARATLRECGMEDAQATPSESVPCTTPLPSTVVPPDQATWDILCAYLAGEEHHGSDISEGRLTEILRHRIGWGRIEVRTAWFDAVARGNALIEADHERIRPIREAEAARLMAEAERRRGGSERTGSDSSSGSS